MLNQLKADHVKTSAKLKRLTKDIDEQIVQDKLKELYHQDDGVHITRVAINDSHGYCVTFSNGMVARRNYYKPIVNIETPYHDAAQRLDCPIGVHTAMAYYRNLDKADSQIMRAAISLLARFDNVFETMAPRAVKKARTKLLASNE